jgi:hypothetical protein
VVAYGSRAALEARIGAARVVQLFDDDGDGLVETTDLETLSTVMGDADDIVTGILLDKGFTLDQLEIVKEDRQLTRAWACVAAQLAGERKPEWLDENGFGPYDALGKRGRDEIKALARGELRSRLELEAGTGGQPAGKNRGLTGDVTDRAFIFLPDPRNRNDRFGPGGF